MSRIEELFRDAVADAPPTRLTADALYDAGRRRRAWFRGGLAALGVAVVGALVGTAVVQPAGPNQSTFDNQTGPIAWAGAGDRDHLYLLRDDCAASYRVEFIKHPAATYDSPHCPQLDASSDGGQTWLGRDLPAPGADWQLTLLGPRTLLAAPTVAGRYLSTDGGSHWAPFSVGTTPLAAVPEGSWAVGWQIPEDSGHPEPVVAAVDPSTGTMRPLAVAPGLVRPLVQPVPAEAGVWVTGTDPVSRRPAVAVSRDAGRTWSTHVFAELAPEFDPPAPSAPAVVAPPGVSFPAYVTTVDGRLVFLTVYSDGAGYIYRSTDGGTTWPRSDPTGHGAQFGSNGTAGLVLRDGAHLVFAAYGPNDVPGQVRFAASRDGGPYQDVPGPALSLLAATSISAVGGGGYFTRDSYGLYASDDGLTWRTIYPA